MSSVVVVVVSLWGILWYWCWIVNIFFMRMMKRTVVLYDLLLFLDTNMDDATTVEKRQRNDAAESPRFYLDRHLVR